MSQSDASLSHDLVKDRLRPRIPALDGVRGLAILLVLIHHAGHMVPQLSRVEILASSFTELLWPGVDLFFALSGFLISGVLLDSRDASNYFSSFYARRVLRIFPLYYVAVFFVLFVVRDRGNGSTLWLLFYLSNWGHLAGAQNLSLLHFWSLAVEEQFYIVWPVVVYVCEAAWLAPLCLCVAFASLAVRVSGWYQPPYVYSLTITRLDALALGAAVAAGVRQPALLRALRLIVRPASLLSAAGLACIAVMRGGLSKTDAVVQNAGFGVISVLCATLVGEVAIGGGGVTRIFSTPFLRVLGRYSYATYVANWPIVYWTQPYLAHVVAGRALRVRLLFEAAYLLGTSAMSFLFALCSWLLIEKHALANKRRFAPRWRSFPAR